MPALNISSSRLRWLDVPSPGDPTRSLPGFAFASATKSGPVFNGDSVRTASIG